MVLLTTSGAHSGRGPCREPEAASCWALAGAPGPVGLVAGGGLPRLRIPDSRGKEARNEAAEAR